MNVSGQGVAAGSVLCSAIYFLIFESDVVGNRLSLSACHWSSLNDSTDVCWQVNFMQLTSSYYVFASKYFPA